MADLTVTPGSVLFTSGTAPVTGYNAGATITAGQSLYLDSSTNPATLKLAQCDGTAAEANAVGIALHAATTGQPLAFAPSGALINIGATTAKTTTYLVSAAAGGVAPQADIVTGGFFIVRLGYATATTGTFVVDLKNTGATV
jgi:hypothetical protein